MSRLVSYFQLMAADDRWANAGLHGASKLFDEEGFAAERNGYATRASKEADGIVEERLDALLAHPFQHQLHHRGQAHAMLARTHVPPPQLDELSLAFDCYRVGPDRDGP